MAQDGTSFVETDISFILHIADFYGSWSITFHPIPVITFILFFVYIFLTFYFSTLYTAIFHSQLRARNCLLFRYTWRNPGFSGVCIAQSLVFCVVLYGSCCPFFHTPVSRRAILCDWVWRAGWRASTQVSA